jgi:hybrid cluster-associated redox disulfide protein
MKITQKTNLLKLIREHPQLAQTLTEKYGLHCLGCMAAAFETLEQGAKAHGMKEREIVKMVKDLNNQIKTGPAKIS